MIRLSIIIPAFNERATIMTVLESVAAHPVTGVEYETIVIDDGSTDGTSKLVETRPELYQKLIVLPRNGGKGAAVRAGLAEATGDFVIFQDADLEYDPADFGRILSPVLLRQADLVMGSRMIAPQVTRVYYFWHRVGNRFLTLLFNVMFNVTFTDIYSCYLLYRRSLLDVRELQRDGWAQQAEILSYVVPRAERLFEVPINYFGRTYGEGKKIRAVHALHVALEIIRGRFRPRRSVLPHAASARP